MELTKDGKEKVDEMPFAKTIDRIVKEDSLERRMQRYIRQELSLKAEEAGFETFEESMDFEIENDFDSELPLSQYETVDMIPEYPDQDGKRPAEPDPAVAPSVEPNQNNQNTEEIPVEKRQEEKE